MEYKIQYGDNFVEFSNPKWLDKDIEFEFMVTIRSGAFGGTATFDCYCSEFERFASETERMYAFESEKAVLKDRYYGSHLIFQADNYGHIHISGMLYDEHRDQRLDFGFTADQTSLTDFIKNWRTFK